MSFGGAPRLRLVLSAARSLPWVGRLARGGARVEHAGATTAPTVVDTPTARRRPISSAPEQVHLWYVLVSGAVAVALATLQLLIALVVLFEPGSVSPASFVHYAVAILLLPRLVRVACGCPLSVGQRSWLVVGLSLHPLGAMYDLYATIWWFDHLTHFVSATLVVAAGYLVGQALVGRPGRVATLRLHAWTFVLIVVAGVSWELFELYTPLLLVHGPQDTAMDLVFDLVGWFVLAVWHAELLGPLPVALRGRFDTLRKRVGPTG